MRLQLRSLVAALALVGSLAVGPKAGATDILTPAGLNPGDTFRFVFVTSTQRNASSTVISDYNTFVTNDATGYTYNNQSITWNAIGSTATVDARDNIGGFNTSVPVYMVIGTKVASNLGTGTGGLWSGTLINGIDRTLGGVELIEYDVWTGTSTAGLSQNPLGTSTPRTGMTGSSDFGWINPIMAVNSINLRMYGISNPLMVPVPEPSTYALGTIATGVMAALARRRKARKA